MSSEPAAEEQADLIERIHLRPPRAPAEVSEQLEDVDPETLQPLQGSLHGGDRPAVHTCQIVDEAPGGCRLRWGNGVSVRIQVGDLAGIRSAQGRGVLWMIGAVRWIKQASDAVEVGVQWLGSSVSAAAVWIWSSPEESAARRLHGLVLPNGRMNNQIFHLFTTPLPYRIGDQITLSTAQVEKRVRLVQALEMTTSFAQFELTSVESQESGPGGPVKGAHELLDRFASLWTRL